MMTSNNQPTPWLVQHLTNEAWYSDGAPKWAKLPTSEQAKTERIKRARLLKKHSVIGLSNVIDRCAPRARCLSGCCPECGRALQRLVAAKGWNILDPASEYDVVSIVGRTQRRLGHLYSLSLGEFKTHLLRALRKGRAGVAIGGIDFSFNEYPITGERSRWVPHLWVLVHNANKPRWERVLRGKYKRHSLVPRPVKSDPWDGDISALGYALKTNFQRRIQSETTRFARGQNRPCRDTRYDRLRVAERLELFEYLHSAGLEARLVLMGLVKSRNGFQIDV